MRLRKLALAVGLASALGAELASALGLGELKLNSALNQPLDAEIELLNIKDLSKDEILVNLAALEEFQRAGVDRLYFLTGLKFTIDLGGPSGPVVRVTTRNPVNEPYLNFLLKAEWPSGNLMREYTLLLDLPTFSNDSVRPIKRAETKTSRSNTVRQPATDSSRSQSTPVSRENSNVSAQQGGSVYGPVSSTDTMWGIALKVRPDRSLSVQQTMLAIQRANPDAFINDNINLLRKGQVLRIPSHNEILDMSARQAISQVAEQNTAWTGKSAERESAAPLDAANRPSTVRRDSDEVEGRVKLGVDADSGNTGYGAGSDESRGEALDNERAISLEELDKSKRQNGELKSRVSDLEAQIETMERMMEIANNDLRAMQLAGQNAGESSGQLPDATATDSAEAVVNATDEAEEAKVVAKPKSSNKVVRRAPPKDKSLIDLALDNILYIGGGLLVLVGGVWMFLRRRKESEDFEEFEEFDEPEELAGVAISAEPDAGDELDALDLDDATAASSDDLDASSDNDSLDVQPSEITAEAETSDVVGEVDIYIAYGKLDQAEQMLLKSLEGDANQVPVLLKLLEVYSESENTEGFDQYYSHLEGLGDDLAIGRAAELRRGFSGASAYVAAAPMTESLSDDLDALLTEGDAASVVEPGDSVDGSDLGAAGELSELDSGEVTVADSAEALLSLDSELDLANLDLSEAEKLEADNLDLELDLDLDLALSDEAGGATATVDDFDLDLDLGLADDEDLGDDLTFDSSSNTDVDLDLNSNVSDEVPDELGVTLDVADELNAAGLSESFDMSLEGDITSTSPAELELSDDLTLEPTENPAVPTTEEAISLELAEEASSELSGEVEQASVTDIDISLDEDLSLEGDLDSEFGDLDLAALDQEMDDLDLDTPAGANEEVAAELNASELDGDTLQEQAEDELFTEAVADVGVAESDLSEFTAESLDAEASVSKGMDDELDFLADTDEVATKLDLARAYIDMGDSEGAKDILAEVQLEGDDTQKSEAKELLGRID
jgi:pilus assembly protein FimV